MNRKHLQNLRKKIDEVDRKMVGLIEERLKIAKEAVKIKEKIGMRVLDKDREREVVDEARKLAVERELNPDFIEDVLRLIISRTAGVERERAGEPSMWAQIQQGFAGNPAQLKVARVLFKYGLRVREDGNVACGNIRIPAVQVAKEAGVDRRAVDLAAKTIFGDENLREIFSNLQPVSFLKWVAQQLGHGVIEILPIDATRKGIISEVTRVISKFDLSIRQSVADDPFFAAQPKLTIVTETPVSGEVVEALRDLPSVESVIVY